MSEGGAASYGTVFKIDPSGSLTTLHSFCSQSGCTDGGYPYHAGLVQGKNGDFYGTTFEGGANGFGTVFRITSGGKFTTLYNFCSQTNCADGENPAAGLIQGKNGEFYGTTTAGGSTTCGACGGTVFRITPSGKLTTLYSFCALENCTDGQDPATPLVQAANGDFYGTTASEGTNGYGTIFKITPGGKLTTLYNLCSQAACATNPSGLIQATDGDFYGTMIDGGTNGSGTVFRVTPSGKLTTLYTFCTEGAPCLDGSGPEGGLVQATDGNLVRDNLGGRRPYRLLARIYRRDGFQDDHNRHADDNIQLLLPNRVR
jgi:uncharacterized repeat protein (TIGR03803 family)